MDERCHVCVVFEATIFKSLSGEYQLAIELECFVELGSLQDLLLFDLL